MKPIDTENNQRLRRAAHLELDLALNDAFTAGTWGRFGAFVTVQGGHGVHVRLMIAPTVQQDLNQRIDNGKRNGHNSVQR